MNDTYKDWCDKLMKIYCKEHNLTYDPKRYGFDGNKLVMYKQEPQTIKDIKDRVVLEVVE